MDSTLEFAVLWAPRREVKEDAASKLAMWLQELSSMGSKAEWTMVLTGTEIAAATADSIFQAMTDLDRRLGRKPDLGTGYTIGFASQDGALTCSVGGHDPHAPNAVLFEVAPESVELFTDADWLRLFERADHLWSIDWGSLRSDKMRESQMDALWGGEPVVGFITFLSSPRVEQLDLHMAPPHVTVGSGLAIILREPHLSDDRVLSARDALQTALYPMRLS